MAHSKTRCKKRDMLSEFYMENEIGLIYFKANYKT